MSPLVLHPRTQLELDALLDRPAQAVLLTGPQGIGKGALTQLLAAKLLGVPETRVPTHAYARHIAADGEAISIEQIRELMHFLSRKVPGNSKRVIIIEGAENLTIEAQNALLKTLEEPPAETHILLTAADEQTLLPTIRSRVSRLQVIRPDAAQLREYFGGHSTDQAKVEQAMLISGGLSGLMHALLENEKHTLLAAIVVTRELIQGTTFERLAMVDKLAKDKTQTMQVFTVLQQMAHLALLQGKSPTSWQRVLTAAYEAASALSTSAQPKLVLTNLMLSL